MVLLGLERALVEFLGTSSIKCRLWFTPQRRKRRMVLLGPAVALAEFPDIGNNLKGPFPCLSARRSWKGASRRSKVNTRYGSNRLRSIVCPHEQMRSMAYAGQHRGGSHLGPVFKTLHMQWWSWHELRPWTRRTSIPVALVIGLLPKPRGSVLQRVLHWRTRLLGITELSCSVGRERLNGEEEEQVSALDHAKWSGKVFTGPPNQGSVRGITQQ